jgi:hypothetical protein
MYTCGVVERKQRLSIEVLPDEAAFIRQVRAAAVLRGVPLRQWVMEALREKYQREH